MNYLAPNILEYGAKCDYLMYALLGKVKIGINEYLLIVAEATKILNLKENEWVFWVDKIDFIPIGVEQIDP